MKHKEKLRIARRLQTKAELTEKNKSVFTSDAWEARKKARATRAANKGKMKILDDKGKEHKVGEIFESETVTLEL